jgi:ectoine hydroxylase
MLQRFFQKYTGVLRAFKPLYVINNFLNRDKLRHNRSLYEQYGLQKSIFSSINSTDFDQHSTDIPWLDRPSALDELPKHPDFLSFSPEIQAQIRHFIENGYLILRGWLDEKQVTEINTEVDRLLAEQKAGFNYTGRKIMAAYEISPIINHYFRQAELIRLLDFIMGKKIVPFHTINFIEGSEQRAHSDSIHMTTEPQGYLIATWTALDDCDAHNGPLFYYPKSHRFPYLMSDGYDSGSTKLILGKDNNRKYEDRIEALLQEKQLEKQYFHAKKGDILLWHANLIHGGSPILKKGTTRKSMVAHYFTEGVICYHEMSQRPALIKT